MPATQQLRPLRYATRQHYAQVPIQSGGAFAAGGLLSTVLPSVGLLAQIDIQVTGVMAASNTATLLNRAPWDLFSNISVRLNMGATTIYSTSGYGNYLVQRTRRRGLDITGDATLYAAGVASGSNNNWILTYRIPIAMNDGDQFQSGLINLQSPEIQVTLEATWNAALTNLAALFTGFTGTAVSVGYKYYELPPVGYGEMPSPLLHRIIENRNTIAAAGDQTIPIPREGILQRIIHYVQQNDAGSDTTVDNFRLLFNKAETVYNRKRWQMKLEQNKLYGSPASAGLPVGAYCWDFWAANAEGQAGWGDPRDFINSEEYATIESVINVPAPSGTLNAIDTIREFYQIPQG